MKHRAQPDRDSAFGARRLGPAARLGSRSLQSFSLAVLFIAGASVALLWLVSLYGDALRDPRYLDGWILVAAISLQIGFHIAVKSIRLSPKAAAKWRKTHIFLGYALIAVFVSHCDFSLPDTGLEWVLWTVVVLIICSGIFGTYLSWSRQSKSGIEDWIAPDRIATRRAEIAQNVHATVTTSSPAAELALPTQPHDGWIMDLYSTSLAHYFSGVRDISAHLVGSHRPLKRLIDEIDALSRYVDPPGKNKLATIRLLVIEKDRLDSAAVHAALSKAWLFVHVPVTYALVVLTTLHVVVVYAFASGAW